MKLPKLFKRGSDDDADDDDEEFEEGFDDLDDMDDFDSPPVDGDDLEAMGNDDLDAPMERNLADEVDDELELERTGPGTGTDSGASGTHFADLDDNDAPDDDAGDRHTADDIDDELVGGDDIGDMPEFDDDDFDDDDYEDDDEDEESGGKRRLIFAAIAGVVLLSSVGGGVAWWMMSAPAEEETASTERRPNSNVRVEMALAPKAGSLNSFADAEPTPSTAPAAMAPAGALTPPPADTPVDPTATPQVGAPTTGTTGQAPTASTAQTAAIPGLGRPLGPPPTGGGGGSLNALVQGNAAPGQGIIVPATVAGSYIGIPDLPDATLSTNPDKKLLEEKDGLPNPLPVVAKNGNRPLDAYARPYDPSDARPRMAVLVTDLGLSRAVTMAAIKKLPPEISLMFSPYARDLEDWVLRARIAGHEVFIGLPMESENFPVVDAGPLALDSSIQVKDNMERLEQVLSRMTRYVGVVSQQGSKFKRAEGQLKPILTAIRDRGLMFVDGSPRRSAAARIAAEINLPKAVVDIVLDSDPTSGAVQRKIIDFEASVRTKGTAIAAAHAYPTTVARLAAWASDLKTKEFALVPVSAIADKQFIE